MSRRRRPDVAELVDYAGMVERSGLPPTTLATWRARHADFPAPIRTFRGVRPLPVWWWPEVEAWIAQRRSGSAGPNPS